jgi:hypothetical protein
VGRLTDHGGVWFGNIEWVAKHFEAVVVMIVVISVSRSSSSLEPRARRGRDAPMFDVLAISTASSALGARMGGWFYVLLFVVIFAETGLGRRAVPARATRCSSRWGRSRPAGHGADRLGARGDRDARPGRSSGDSTNYWVGRWVGPRVLKSETSRFLNRKHLAGPRRSTRSTAARR